MDVSDDCELEEMVTWMQSWDRRINRLAIV